MHMLRFIRVENEVKAGLLNLKDIRSKLAMTDQEKDAFLSEKFGICYHTWGTANTFGQQQCTKCHEINIKFEGNPFRLEIKGNLLSSTWEGFGLLWERALSKPWWWLFHDYFISIDRRKTNLKYINPIEFRDKLCKFLLEYPKFDLKE